MLRSRLKFKGCFNNKNGFFEEFYEAILRHYALLRKSELNFCILKKFIIEINFYDKKKFDFLIKCFFFNYAFSVLNEMFAL